LIVKLFDFIKFLAQIINKLSKVQQKENNLIYAKMIKGSIVYAKIGC
jgi:hypothetical protein